MSGFATRWFGMRQNLGTRYNPLYFLAALGNGGMVITFFIWLNFLIPHPKTPIITFDGIAAFMSKATFLPQTMTIVAMAMMIFFAVRHLRILFWNLREFGTYRKTSAYATLRDTNAAVGLIAMPLTLAMSVNVLFAMGAVFVPGLWNIVEYLFPFAMLAFTVIGVFAIRTFLGYFARAVATGHFDCTRNNHLSQMQAVMTFAMLGVGFAAPAAMSTIKTTVAISMLGSIFFLIAAAVMGVILMTLGFRGMLEHGLAVEAAPSLWVLIPILTLGGIALVRINHGLHTAFGAHTEPYGMFLLTGAILGLQLFTGIVGYTVMSQVGYFRTYVWGTSRSPGSYALICPAVALFVLGMFFVHLGLVKNGLIVKYSVAHIAIMLPFLAVQIMGIVTMFRLDSKLIRPDDPAASQDGEPIATPDIATA
jgi:hypothetical protein